MNIEAELAGLRATVDAGFKQATRDREEQRQEAQSDRQAIKETFAQFATKCDSGIAAANLRIDAHDDVIQQLSGATKVLGRIGAFFGVLWAGLEAAFHMLKK